MKKIFIVNPISGDGKSIEIANEIKKLLDEDHDEYEMYYTKAPKDATKIAKQFSNNKETHIIYSVGGDGTLFEIVNGMHESNNLLGIIPAGTGNDFMKCINSESDITYVDLCKMNEHYFINIGSVGIDAEIAHNEPKMKEFHIPKSLRYKASIIYTIFKFKFPHLDIQINEQSLHQDITILAICNGRYYGGGFQIAPNANYNDGKFDVYLADKVKKLKMPGLFLRVIKTTHEKAKCIHKLSTKQVIIHSDKPISCNLDGEIFQLTDMDFSITDKKIPVYTANDKIKKLCKSKGLYK